MNAKATFPWTAWRDVSLPVVGMLHVPPLPGSPRGQSRMVEIRDHVLHDVDALLGGGIHGLMIENFGDTPFFPQSVPAATVAQLTWLLSEVKRVATIPCGVNVLRNDGISAIAVAAAGGAEFVRINVLSGARLTDQGLIQGQAHEVLRERARLMAESIQIWADVDVKHSAPLAPRRLADEVADLVHRAHADAVIVTGRSTGSAADVSQVAEVVEFAEGTPVVVGSGVNVDTIASLRGKASAVIVGSSLKRDGKAENPVDSSQVKALIAALES